MSVIVQDGEGEPERRRDERRVAVRVSELTLPELRRIVLTSLLFATVLGLFLWMVRGVIIAGILGLIIAIYLRPFNGWLDSRLGDRRRLASLLTLTGLIVPLVAVVIYGYFEVLRVADYLVANEAQVAAEIAREVRELPGIRYEVEDDGEVEGVSPQRVDGAVAAAVSRVAALADGLPGQVGRSLGRFSIGATIFLFTAFYVLTRGEAISAYLRAQIPHRYAELVGALEDNARGVLYGAMYSSLVVQVVKSAVLFVLFLLLEVPIAGVLAVASFVIGFFPVVGSWSVYLPVAAWLLIFADDALGAALVVGVGIVVNTLFLSTYLRPKLAADRSHVLDFYWMLLGLVTGVYTFGLAGVVLGPIVIGLLKAIVDTVANRASWRLVEQEYGD